MKQLGHRFHKPIWMSEVGCCFASQGDQTEMWGALFMADTIRADLRDMGAEVWVRWQPDWGLIAFDSEDGEPLLKKQFFALAQYTRFIRPGFEIISAGRAHNTLATYSPRSKRLVLVSTNWEMDTPIDLDLSAFGPSSATSDALSYDKRRFGQSSTRQHYHFILVKSCRPAAGAFDHHVCDRWR